MDSSSKSFAQAIKTVMQEDLSDDFAWPVECYKAELAFYFSKEEVEYLSKLLQFALIENQRKQTDVDNDEDKINDITDNDEQENDQAIILDPEKSNQDNKENGAIGDATDVDNYGKPVEEIPNSNELMLIISYDQAQVFDDLEETYDYQEKCLSSTRAGDCWPQAE
ncbi:hypothetical protein ACH5RR_001337 [Cinchona calisaya]|uniref:Uncharacterized protein n=1 Tax=Cinchona calisaya TaxID=153742 RepID=A0ABD3B3J8_9GENT